jgi:gluconate 2-dehydrogenase gamma chain
MNDAEDQSDRTPVDVPVAEQHPQEANTQRPARVSRRGFLTTSSVALASGGLATLGAAAVTGVAAAPPLQSATPAAAGTPEQSAEEADVALVEDSVGPPPIAFFNIHEAETVEAFTARILPGSPDDPGAREAGVVYYIDRTLGGAGLGYSLKTYTQGPFPVVTEEPVTVEAASSRDIYDYVNVASEQIARYGYQSVLAPQEIYRRGLAFLDAYTQSEFESNFLDLTEEQQDQVLTAMDEDTATGFEGPSAKAFFTQLRNDTIEGMFGDPMYGGNRDLVGWKLIGYPGAQRFYTPDDIKNPGFRREPQSLAQLMVKEGH